MSCAYSGRLVAWLRTAYPNATILFENRAVGGMTTGFSLLTLPTSALPIRADEDVDVEDDDSASTSSAQPSAVARGRSASTGGGALARSAAPSRRSRRAGSGR